MLENAVPFAHMQSYLISMCVKSVAVHFKKLIDINLFGLDACLQSLSAANNILYNI